MTHFDIICQTCSCAFLFSSYSRLCLSSPVSLFPPLAITSIHLAVSPSFPIPESLTLALHQVLLLQEMLDVWQRCDLLLSEVEVWCTAADAELGSPAARSRPLRRQLTEVQRVPAEIARRETEVAREADRLMVGDGVLRGAGRGGAIDALALDTDSAKNTAFRR